MIESAVTVLPEPDSPTSPSVSPSPMVRLTWSTTCTLPCGVSNRMSRFSTRSTSFFPTPFPTRAAGDPGGETVAGSRGLAAMAV